MTSAIAGSSATYQRPSPLEQLKKTLETQVSNGTVAASDESALSSALDSIDASMTSSRKSEASGGGDPKSKIDSLIDAQVSSGSLTSDQADELRNVFASAFGGRAEGAGRPHHGPPPSATQDDDETTAISDTTDSNGSTDIATLLQELMKRVGQTNAPYTAGGTATATAGTTASSLFVDRAV